LNDPKEAKPKIAPKSLDEFIEILLRLRGKMSTEETQYHRRVLEYNLPRFGGADFMIKEFEERLPKEFESKRIYSASKRPDNLHLWKKYADSHRGYCLEFRSDGLFKGHIREVRYSDYYEADITTQTGRSLSAFFYYKTTGWRREEELRIVGQRSAESGMVTFNQSMLTRIFLGKRMHEENQNIIRAWARNRVPVLVVESASSMNLS
jgi:hypothetical protein